MHPPYAGGLNLPNFKKGGLDRTSILRGRLLKKRGGGNFFQGVAILQEKNTKI